MNAQAMTSVEMIRRLVGFDTTSRNSNLDLIHFVQDYLAGFGVESRLIHDESGHKANLYATIGPNDRPGITLSGHTDVVPVDGQDWSSDPFTVEQRDDRLYGRGTADMKSFVAVALALVPEFVARPLKTPINFAFSYDEEIGCFGAHGIIRHLRGGGVLPRLVIVGEPSGMRVVNAHKGIRTFTTTVTGLEAHSSATDRGVNAIFYGARLIAFLDDLAAEFRERGDASGRFDPPYTTINVGLTNGGTALNIIPGTCRFVWESRLLPDQDADEIVNRFEAFAAETLLPEMRRTFDRASIVTEDRVMVPGLRPEAGSDAETFVMALVETNQTHAVSYATEAGLFQEAEMPTVICGPGDIAQAHKPDEFIALEQVQECEAFMRRLLHRVGTA